MSACLICAQGDRVLLRARRASVCAHCLDPGQREFILNPALRALVADLPPTHTRSRARHRPGVG
jgi:hypothetical protein